MLKQERQSRLKATDVPSDGIRGRFELSRVRHAILIFGKYLNEATLFPITYLERTHYATLILLQQSSFRILYVLLGPVSLSTRK